MKVIESYWKDTAAVWENTNDPVILFSVSDFPSSIYANVRKSVKNASDSSHNKLISYSSIFASNF